MYLNSDYFGIVSNIFSKCVFPQCCHILKTAPSLYHPGEKVCPNYYHCFQMTVRVCPSAHRIPHYRASLNQHGGLTSLKRFQCLILRLYCEMVDSHCSSSMKFPVFSASLPLFTSVCKVDPANITSGTRRHTISVISTMV